MLRHSLLNASAIPLRPSLYCSILSASAASLHLPRSSSPRIASRKRRFPGTSPIWKKSVAGAVFDLQNTWGRDRKKDFFLHNSPCCTLTTHTKSPPGLSSSTESPMAPTGMWPSPRPPLTTQHHTRSYAGRQSSHPQTCLGGPYGRGPSWTSVPPAFSSWDLFKDKV